MPINGLWSVVVKRDRHAVCAVDFRSRRAALSHSVSLGRAAIRGDYSAADA
jgi:hypothetical protein